MRTNRLEAFSDGVFAIVITLLVLDIRIPEVPYPNLPETLWGILPRIASYVLSFIVIGLYWVFHYVYFERIKFVNGTLLALNLVGLLLISFMPIPTSLMGRYPLQSWPIVLYGLSLIAVNMTALVTVVYLQRNPSLLREQLIQQDFKGQMLVYVWVNVPYVLALVIAFVFPVLSYVIFLVIFVAVGFNTWRQLNTLRRVG